MSEHKPKPVLRANGCARCAMDCPLYCLETHEQHEITGGVDCNDEGGMCEPWYVATIEARDREIERLNAECTKRLDAFLNTDIELSDAEARAEQAERKIERLRIAWKRDCKKGDAWFAELTEARATLEAVREAWRNKGDSWTDLHDALVPLLGRTTPNVAFGEAATPTPAPEED